MGRVWSVFLLVAWVGVTGCATAQPGRKLAWRTVSKGLVSGLTEARRSVVRSESEYYTLWAAHAAEATQVALPPAVDFSREMVLVVTMGPRPTGGYVIDVVDVELRGKTLRVLIGEREPRPGTFQIQRRTQPFVMVALPAMVARVQFRSVREAELRGGRRKARPGVEGDAVGGGSGAGAGERGQEPVRSGVPRAPVRAREPDPMLQSPRGATR